MKEKIQSIQSTNEYSTEHEKILSDVYIVQNNRNSFDLRQPSALEEVDSITTYAVSFTSTENK